MNEVKNPETQLRCGYAFGVERNLRLLYLGAERHGLRREYALRRVAQPAVALLGGLKSTAYAVSTPYGVWRNLRLLCLGLVRGLVSGKAR